MYKKNYCVLIATFSLLCGLSSSCNNTESKAMGDYQINPVVVEYVTKTTRSEDVAYMKELLENAIQSWVKEYSSMGFYKEEDYHVSDIMLFAKSKDKVLIFVSALLKDSDDGEVKLLTGKLESDDTWYFRHTGLPSFYYEYNEGFRKGEKFTETELLARTIDQMVNDGLINSFKQISQRYLLNKWF